MDTLHFTRREQTDVIRSHYNQHIVIVKIQHVKVISKHCHHRIGCQAEKIIFQQAIIHFPTSMVTITTFTLHEKQIPLLQEPNRRIKSFIKNTTTTLKSTTHNIYRFISHR